MVFDKFLTKSLRFKLSENSINFNKFMILKENQLYYRVAFSIDCEGFELYSYVDLFMGLELEMIVENYNQTLSDFDYMFNKACLADDNIFLNHLYSKWLFEFQDFDFKGKSYIESLYCKESDLESDNVKFFNRLCDCDIFIDAPADFKKVSYVN